MPKQRKTVAVAVSTASELPPRRVLEDQWKARFGRPLSRTMRRPLAVQVLRFHEQEATLCVSREVEAHLASLLPRRSRQKAPASTEPPRRLKPGTRLLRTWRGEVYSVLVGDPGFIYQGTVYRSLSVIARHITGTPWSGPAFFGLKKPKRGEAAT